METLNRDHNHLFLLFLDTLKKGGNTVYTINILFIGFPTVVFLLHNLAI